MKAATLTTETPILLDENPSDEVVTDPNILAEVKLPTKPSKFNSDYHNYIFTLLIGIPRI